MRKGRNGSFLTARVVSLFTEEGTDRAATPGAGAPCGKSKYMSPSVALLLDQLLTETRKTPNVFLLRISILDDCILFSDGPNRLHTCYLCLWELQTNDTFIQHLS